jgi:intracellular sulfur oxidation DsrE/DsrF family protein
METQMSRNVSRFFAAVLLALAPCLASAQDKVVYHFDDAATQATKGLRNIKNHLDTDAAAQITVVAHAQGVDFLMDGAQDKGGYPYQLLVADLVKRGVKFEICEITLKNRNLKREQFVAEATFTPSGVVRIAQLQSKERAAYIKP